MHFNTSTMRRRWVAMLLWATAWIVSAGCGSKHSDHRRYGNGHLPGPAVAAANVMFACTAGRPAYAITDAAGRFRLTTFSEGDGALAGEHTVTISKYVSISPATGKPNAAGPAVVDDSHWPAASRRPTGNPRTLRLAEPVAAESHRYPGRRQLFQV